MSYRAFKRLLGETSLERKCRFLFGAGILLLITGSFWLYAYLTEQLAYKQASPLGRLLVNWVITKQHLEKLHVSQWQWSTLTNNDLDEGLKNPPALAAKEWQQFSMALKDLALDEQSNELLPEAAREYQHIIIKPKARNRINQPEDSFEADLLKEFLADKNKYEESREPASKQ